MKDLLIPTEKAQHILNRGHRSFGHILTVPQPDSVSELPALERERTVLGRAYLAYLLRGVVDGTLFDAEERSTRWCKEEIDLMCWSG